MSWFILSEDEVKGGAFSGCPLYLFIVTLSGVEAPSPIKRMLLPSGLAFTP